mmetsp:Transcript_42915/g.121274  ORF Transcript_42915/g.121274 Transcript_42915/m.121274 type:complete len:262 (+) Transcript_42915:9-794(+)
MCVCVCACARWSDAKTSLPSSQAHAVFVPIGWLLASHPSHRRVLPNTCIEDLSRGPRRREAGAPGGVHHRPDQSSADIGRDAEIPCFDLEHGIATCFVWQRFEIDQHRGNALTPGPHRSVPCGLCVRMRRGRGLADPPTHEPHRFDLAHRYIEGIRSPKPDVDDCRVCAMARVAEEGGPRPARDGLLAYSRRWLPQLFLIRQVDQTLCLLLGHHLLHGDDGHRSAAHQLALGNRGEPRDRVPGLDGHLGHHCVVGVAEDLR